jgi:hypothetical protein
MDEHQDKRHPVGVSHSPTQRRSRLAPAFAVGCMLVASPAWARIEILFHHITASTEIRYSDPSGTATHVSSRDEQFSLPPFVAFSDATGPANGIAEAYLARPGVTLGRQLYAASVQRSTSNAVAAQTTYTGGTTVALQAITHWGITVKNPGTAPEPVDLSFFISGGGLDAYCATCVAGGLLMSTTARISHGINDDANNQLWMSRTELDATSTDHADLRNGARPVPLGPFGPLDRIGSYDPAGIGFLAASMFHVPDAQDPYFRASVDPFNATLRVFTLQPGQSADLNYFLEARIEGSGAALGAAWLVDPFSLGSTDIPLPLSGFALNGVPIAALLVPEPSRWFLTLAGAAVVAAGSRRRCRGRKAASIRGVACA